MTETVRSYRELKVWQPERDTRLIAAVELGHVTAENAQHVFDLLLEIRKMTYALINKLPSQ